MNEVNDELGDINNLSDRFQFIFNFIVIQMN